jgi:hypothetical protein
MTSNVLLRRTHYFPSRSRRFKLPDVAVFNVTIVLQRSESLCYFVLSFPDFLVTNPAFTEHRRNRGKETVPMGETELNNGVPMGVVSQLVLV